MATRHGFDSAIVAVVRFGFTPAGGGVIKQRVARPGQGRSGGYRSIIIFKKGERAFFVYGFAKSDRENIDLDEAAEFKKLARAWFTFSDRKIEAMIKDRELTEVEL